MRCEFDVRDTKFTGSVVDLSIPHVGHIMSQINWTQLQSKKEERVQMSLTCTAMRMPTFANTVNL